MIAPSAKGVFAAVRPNQRELIVALITTSEPIGDLLAQVVRAGGGDILPKILQALAEKMERMRQQAKLEKAELEAATREAAEELETVEAPTQ